MFENNAMQLKRFFEPISSAEFLEFWKELPENEKEEWRKADLS